MKYSSQGKSLTDYISIIVVIVNKGEVIVGSKELF